MSKPTLHSLDTTATGYKAMRGNTRQSFLGFVIGHLRTGGTLTESQEQALADIASIAIASESKEVAARASEITVLLCRLSEQQTPEQVREAGFADQAECDRLDAEAREAQAHEERPFAEPALESENDKPAEALHHDEQEACAESAGLGQPAEFDGLSELAVRVFLAIMRTLGTRTKLFFDELPVVELGRVNVGQIRQACDELEQAHIICQLNPGGALHDLGPTPGLLGRIRDGLVKLPLPCGCADPAAPRKARTPRQPGTKGGGVYLRVVERAAGGERSHKCLNRRVAIEVLAALEQGGQEYEVATIKGEDFTALRQVARDIAKDAKGTLLLPDPSSSYRPAGWKNRTPAAV